MTHKDYEERVQRFEDKEAARERYLQERERYLQEFSNATGWQFLSALVGAVAAPTASFSGNLGWTWLPRLAFAVLAGASLAVFVLATVRLLLLRRPES